jgi:TPR repeat protein
MRFLVTCLLFACAAASGQTPARPDQPDPDLSRAGPAWLVGDHVQARRLFRAAAERGHPLGQYNLAMMLVHGEGGPRRPAEAQALLRRAADNGVELARRELALRSAQAR